MLYSIFHRKQTTTTLKSRHIKSVIIIIKVEHLYYDTLAVTNLGACYGDDSKHEKQEEKRKTTIQVQQDTPLSICGLNNHDVQKDSSGKLQFL